mmetsp:Transcript_20517/g.36070  ORF Transcript_20517/g.36070 Transcript_20517/m.36070 type:complete len:96 (-) Transcript_20517:485-772(-)
MGRVERHSRHQQCTLSWNKLSSDGTKPASSCMMPRHALGYTPAPGRLSDQTARQLAAEPRRDDVALPSAAAPPVRLMSFSAMERKMLSSVGCDAE